MHLFPLRRKRRRGRHRRHRFWYQNLREWLWPSMGWVSLMRWIELKLKRSSGSTHSMALGVAAGVFASCTPFVGMHSFIAVVISLILGGNFLAALLGTFFGNPWTFPFIWLATYELGNILLLRHDSAELPKVIEFSQILENFTFYFHTYLLPMAVGGLPLGILCAVPSYFLVRWQLRKYHKRRRKHLAEARLRNQMRKSLVTGAKIIKGKFTPPKDKEGGE